MKIVRFTLIVFFFQAAMAQELKLGDNLETALAKLGKPIGNIELRDKTLLLYPEGEVMIKDDAVVSIDLMSADAFAAEQARLETEREQWLADQARRREAHKKEGLALLKEKRGSHAFAALPAKDRVDYWRTFQIRYPEVDSSEDLARALEGYETELTELRNQQRIAQLEARVAQAEKEAATARLETERLKAEAEKAKESTHYGLRYYYDPVVRPRYIYRPPTVTIYTNGNQKCPETKKPDYWHFRKYNPNGTAEQVAKLLHESKKN